MSFINEITLAYPVTERQIKALYPNTAFPEPFVPPAPFAVVFESPVPAYDAMTHFVKEIAPAKDAQNRWVRRYEVVARSQEEITANVTARNSVLLKVIIDAAQERLDSFARTRGYDGIMSLCTYATSTHPIFAVEGQYGVEARDATWSTLYQMLAEVQGGTRPLPTGYADIEPYMPALAWPI